MKQDLQTMMLRWKQKGEGKRRRMIVVVVVYIHTASLDKCQGQEVERESNLVPSACYHVVGFAMMTRIMMMTVKRMMNAVEGRQ